MTGMRVLVLGADVIGSFNAARLARGGADVTLLARGRRLADLRKQGVILEDRRTGGPANGPGQRFPSSSGSGTRTATTSLS
jgi:ketopantoate reductase